ncbi:high-temperature-induced dauer-formation protein-domain-containing protein [Pilobolus umbonatus]|nr:high-temperature-induced dauer-formation protein-domain-containing protein [Pilobolus umbonatus]
MSQIIHSSNFPSQENSITQLLNCIRILARLIPFLFEETEAADWEGAFFWTTRQQKKQSQEDSKPEYEILPPRGEVLMKLTIEAMFLAGFTLPISFGTKETKVVYTIWENGVGSTQVPISTARDNESNRTEVLRLLAVLLSKSMYHTPTQLLTKEDIWLNYMVTKLDRKTTLVILCSLMNTICNYDPTGWVPYNHIVMADITREQLATLSSTTLLILLDYHPPSQVELIRKNDQQSSSDGIVSETSISHLEDVDINDKTGIELDGFSPTDQHNTITDFRYNPFCHNMSKLHRKEDFEFLMNGIYRILSNPMTAANTYLPGSTKRVRCYIDVMMLCWRLLETNPRFIEYLIETDRVLDLSVVLIFHMSENKDKIAQIGLVRMCAFMLQTLSSSKEYSIKLNKQFITHSSLPASIRLYAFNGTYADFLIISIFSTIATTHGTLSSLYPALVLTLCNISAYVKNMSVTSVSKLMSMFHSMSLPTFLLADEHNYQLTIYLLETFNNIIHYQFKENPNVIYSLVLHHDYFEKLDKLTLTDAMAEVERIQSLRAPNKESTPNESPIMFIPSEDWMAYWKPKLHLDTILPLLKNLVPKIEEKCANEPNVSLEDLLAYINSVPLDDTLPEDKAPIYVRKFQWGEALMIWFRSLLWGQNYISFMVEYGPWTGTRVKLFEIKQE